MTNEKTIRERLAIIETKLGAQMNWMKAVIIAVLASVGINLAQIPI